MKEAHKKELKVIKVVDVLAITQTTFVSMYYIRYHTITEQCPTEDQLSSVHMAHLCNSYIPPDRAFTGSISTWMSLSQLLHSGVNSRPSAIIYN